MYVNKSVIRRMLKDAGAARVSESAVRALQDRLNRIAYDGAKKAVMLSKHAKRKTVEESDVRLAMQ
ncbi:MAG: NFYB/HAP3 family transcription factor subunit [Candidatus Marsarchaeota archaeon]|jgi:histone H3/H4|nr:NFYB/HAP3 family transcription factor subunit [Candidatus Marsarchaeota archaeon]